MQGHDGMETPQACSAISLTRRPPRAEDDDDAGDGATGRRRRGGRGDEGCRVPSRRPAGGGPRRGGCEGG